jgi:hypothetical protein
MKGITVNLQKVLVLTHDLVQGMVFAIAGYDYVVTDPIKQDAAGNYVVHYALVNPNILKQGTLVMPPLMWFEVDPYE